MKPSVVRATALWLSLVFGARGADVSSIGNWTETIDRNDLVAGAGSNLNSQYESISGTTTIDIANTGGGSWRILVRRSDGTWHGNLTLYIRRSSDGSGAGSILGGGAYVQISTLDTELFTGSGDRTNVALQFKLTGMSKDISPNTYSSGIIFTVASQ